MALFLGSCHDQLLNPIPESVLTTANAFKKASDLNLAVLGVYSLYQSRLPTDYELMETPSDNLYGVYFAVSPGMAEIALLTVAPENPKLNSFWKTTYNGIFRANSVLGNINNPTDYAEGQKEQYIAEAKFMRALMYFDLVRIFGGVPAVTEVITEGEDIPRASEQEIYDLIIADLNEAVTNLPEPDAIVKGRASNAAAIALLSKVYIYRENWSEAKSNLEKLFNKNKYSLVSEYGDLFAEETENNSEVIFTMPYIAGTNGQSLTIDLTPHGGIYQVITGGNRTVRPTWDLEKAFDPEDSRLPVTIEDYQKLYTWKPGDEIIWYNHINKWIVPTPVGSKSGLDIPVMRLADMILFYAEALYHTGDPAGALAQINKVRERAFGNASHNYTLADISTEETFLDKLLLERRLELAVENSRWFDLVRTGRFTSVLTTIEGEYNNVTKETVKIPLNAKPYMKYFPIPWEQINLANPGVLTQNEGYD